MLRPTARRAMGERGSVALVVMVIFVMASLAAIMVTRSAGDLRLSVIEQHQAAADAASDLGIARAVARIQVGESATGFDDIGSVADATWSVNVRQVDATRWDLISTGQSGSSTRPVLRRDRSGRQRGLGGRRMASARRRREPPGDHDHDSSTDNDHLHHDDHDPCADRCHVRLVDGHRRARR